MPLDTAYDSPTFLSQKDKMLFGLTLVQMMMLLGVGAFYFLLTFMLPFLGSMITRLLVLVPAVGITAVIMFVRISGMALPTYLYMAVTVTLRRAVYEEKQEMLLRGDPVWLAEQLVKGGKGRLGRKKAALEAAVDIDQRKAEVKADVDKAMTEGSVAAQQWVQDGVRTLMKGR